MYIVAADALRSTQLIAAAVIYDSVTPEPSFSYRHNGKEKTEYLLRKGARVPSFLASALSEHIRSTSLSWALVTAHADCQVEKALELAVIRAVERWVCRLTTVPSLEETRLYLPGTKPLASLPQTIHQVVRTKDWRTSSARALCRHHDLKEPDHVSHGIPPLQR